MARREFSLTPDQIRDLQYKIDKCADPTTRIRLQGILMYGTGSPINEILEYLNCSRSSLLNWCQAYQINGVAKVEDQRRGGNNARLTDTQIEELILRLQTYSPNDLPKNGDGFSNRKDWTAKDLFKAIKLWYGVVYRSRTSYYRLMEIYQQHTGSQSPSEG